MKKEKKYKRPIDMRHHDEIIDIAHSGFMDTRDNHGYLLKELLSRKTIPTKSSKVIVYCTSIVGDPDDPERINVKKIYTFGYLLRLWEKMYGEQFSIDKFQEKNRNEIAAMEKDGDRRAAWHMYGASVRLNQEVESERKFKESICDLSPSQQEEAKRNREKEERGKPNQLIIG